MTRKLLLAALVAPLLLTAAPVSFLAHDAGYYGLQARWIEQGGPWLAPLWFGQPLFDRCIGAQWLMALGLRLNGSTGDGLPALLAGAVSLALSGWLAQRLLPGSASERRQLAGLTVLLLALTPLWLNQAHLATQDMPLLAVELAGIAALVACSQEGEGGGRWPRLLVGLAPGLAFLIKGFMVAVPLLAITPFLLLERRWLLRRPCFWLGLVLGWLPVALWLGASIHSFGLPVVAGLWDKLLFLSRSNAYAPGPFYYLWNIPVNTLPWSLAALMGWPLLWRRGLRREASLVVLLYPLLMVLLLSAFRTKTPYYGLQITPWIAMAAAVALQRWSLAVAGRRRSIDLAIATVAALVLTATGLVVLPAAPLHSLLAEARGLPGWPALLLAGTGLSVAWLVAPWQRLPRRRLAALLLGPWLALLTLTQAGLFSDRSPELRQALAAPAIQNLLRRPGIQAAAGQPLSEAEHAQLILLALATADTPDQLLQPQAVAPGQLVWIRRPELDASGPWQVHLSAPALEDWVLAERRSTPPPSAPSDPVQVLR